jgi:hypothetical protein
MLFYFYQLIPLLTLSITFVQLIYHPFAINSSDNQLTYSFLAIFLPVELTRTLHQLHRTNLFYMYTTIL